MSKQDQLQTKKNKKVTICVRNTQYEVIADVAEQDLNFKIVKSLDQDYDIFWTDGQVPIEMYYNLRSNQKINFFPGIDQIANKALMNSNLSYFQQLFPEEFNFFPKTWTMPKEFRQLKQQMIEDDSKFYIQKPDNGCQGNGIILISNYQQIEFNGHKSVIQDYINNPYLIDNLKWDLRLYVLLLGIDPLRIYLYQEGMARFATVPYENPNQFLNKIEKIKTMFFNTQRIMLLIKIIHFLFTIMMKTQHFWDINEVYLQFQISFNVQFIL